MGTLANAFALLADQQGQEASTIVALKTAEVKKISEEKKKAEVKKKKKSCVRDGGRGKEGHGYNVQRSLDSKAHQLNGRSNGSGNPYGRGDGTVYMSYPKAKGNTKDGQGNQEHKAVNRQGDENQGKVSVRSVVLSKEELHERWLAKEKERKKEEAERKERWLAREEERRQEMAMKTLKEYEEHKAYEKQKADKATLSVTETPAVREATLDNIYTKQKSNDETVEKYSNIVKYGKSKDETVKKDSNIVKYGKVHKTKLPTGREGQESQDGPGRGMGEDFRKNRNGSWEGYSKIRATDNQEYALPNENITVKVKAGPAPDLSETSFPVLGKATNPIQFHWEDSRRDYVLAWLNESS